jgi:hypothetical protein
MCTEVAASAAARDRFQICSEVRPANGAGLAADVGSADVEPDPETDVGLATDAELEAELTVEGGAWGVECVHPAVRPTQAIIAAVVVARDIAISVPERKGDGVSTLGQSII